jgi:ATP/maltotriose-dependent transcriptional regulator MalT/DNA-binding SARP family transcriptional activator
MEELRVHVEPIPVLYPHLTSTPARLGFPLQLGKIQAPMLPERTLRRERLLDSLERRSRNRVVYIVAEAGFGKTTLVADFLRQSRLRAFWYRLDEAETDGLTFLRYLVASCQTVDPALLRRTGSLLSETGIEPTCLSSLLETALGEIEQLGEVPSALVLDDFHMCDRVSGVAELVERLISQAPEGLCFVIISRRTPGLQVAALRARGEVTELGREELRFEENETSRLFHEAYGHRLEPDVVHELQRRTEGWAASLQLVHAAVDGLSPGQVRKFVFSLDGASGSLYDYLAEEVVGDLTPELRGFLMRVALLDEIAPDVAGVAAGVTAIAARAHLETAQTMGLVLRNLGTPASWRLHPLVGQYLLARLDDQIGHDGIVALHRQLAATLEAGSWRLAARHWASAGDADQVRRIICSALPAIIGTGDIAVAAELIARFPDFQPNPWYDIISSRQLAVEGRYEEAVEVAVSSARICREETAADADFRAVASLNLLHLGIQRGDSPMMRASARDLMECGDKELASIARSSLLIWEAGDAGSLDALCRALSETAALNRDRDHPRHQGISLTNLAHCEFIRDNHAAAVRAGEAACELLAVAGDRIDVQASHLNAARSHAHLGHVAEWQAHVTAATNEGQAEPASLAEAAELEAFYGDPATGLRLLKSVGGSANGCKGDPYALQVAARLRLLHADSDTAARWLSQVSDYGLSPGFRCAAAALRLQIDAYGGSCDATLGIQSLELAERQQAWFWWKSMRLSRALASGSEELTPYIRTLQDPDSAYLSLQAELVARRLEDLDLAAFEIVRSEATRRPHRWRWAVRQMLGNHKSRAGDVRRGSQLLELIGDAEDIGRLRSVAKRKSLRVPEAGRMLAKRLAPPAHVDDLGRISICIGDRTIAGTEIRKKVLSLLVYLLTRPRLTASREQVIEALWPDMEPEAGANSLNQTSYFLRQVFEPRATDDSTAGYLNSRADLIWLDQDLVRSRSAECMRLIAASRLDPSPEMVVRLAEAYTGRFAVDFLYDDWAAAFRNTLHASYLDRVERSLDVDAKAGHLDRAIAVAQMALAADPDAEQIELCLLRLYRRTGAYAAAAEQYEHYAIVMREQLGIEPPPLDSL